MLFLVVRGKEVPICFDKQYKEAAEDKREQISLVADTPMCEIEGALIFPDSYLELKRNSGRYIYMHMCMNQFESYHTNSGAFCHWWQLCSGILKVAP